ncbi:tRNA dihydrouridine(20/20a) synthase DusA [Marivita sp. S6314]|uniref:tRNA dihydrouridine(20/20a) synthase DusA n=1 Tax=Marivita sp. S6314 TaxID=2926406 RepID=UPI001FF5D9C1|nr:tRNA dihydrouridine(20/20a) synthase DusA [Marivita sp. S6314]MCK0150883.1 tRNA dihydrouridine(20/20a) synthase DusA [Marivita sp. S6314]
MNASRLSVAPMMDWTDRHCRFFHRQISRHALLYTEMVTSPALVRGGAQHLLAYSDEEHPVALQLGGSDPEELAEAARMGAAAGYDEINLNVGCPSDRVQSGTFGAVLMKSPDLVACCVAAMKRVVDVPVTVKCRIGVDDQEPEKILPDFITRVSEAGCDYLIIHARKAWLQGLSPKENRDIPPLDYGLVQDMKARFPALGISINGGVETLAEAEALIAQGLDGVMIGRAAYHRPWDILSEVDVRLFGASPAASSRAQVLDAMRPYIAAHVAEGGKVHHVTRHMLGLYAGQPGARLWRRVLSERANQPGVGAELIDEALEAMDQPDRLAG